MCANLSVSHTATRVDICEFVSHHIASRELEEKENAVHACTHASVTPLHVTHMHMHMCMRMRMHCHTHAHAHADTHARAHAHADADAHAHAHARLAISQGELDDTVCNQQWEFDYTICNQQSHCRLHKV